MNYEELAKRVVACKGWRWMPGMKALGKKDMPTAWFRLEETIQNLHGDWSNATPDLSDPATIGCLINLVRIAWNGRVAISMGNGWWSVEADSDNDGFYSDQDCSSSFNESLVLAFEAANE